jgi:hypothetical protein
MNDVFRHEVIEELDEIGDALHNVLEHARDQQETDPGPQLNRLIADLRLAYEHVGSAVAALEPPDA